MTRIIVGVDGSPHSRRALRRAIEEAGLRNGAVEAIYVYPPPHRKWWDDLIGLPSGADAAVGVGSISPSGPAHHPPSIDDEAFAEAQTKVETFVTEAAVGITGPPPRVLSMAAEHPAEALIEQSRTADLLVIGTRGYGGFKGMLLGSVARECIQQSRCPVLILPPEED